MWQKSNKFLSLSFMLILTALGCIAYQNEAPLITPSTPSLILDVNVNQIITCESNEPIFWKTPENTPLYEIVPYEPLNNSLSFGSELQLYNISYENVGYYFCIKNASAPNNPEDLGELIELTNKKHASSIYIYVNDSDHMLAHPSSTVFYALETKNLEIPCKPTMPKIEVLLVSTFNGNMTYSSRTSRKYDSKRGFEIKFISDYAGIYECRPKKPSPTNIEEKQIFNITKAKTNDMLILLDIGQNNTNPLNLRTNTNRTSKQPLANINANSDEHIFVIDKQDDDVFTTPRYSQKFFRHSTPGSMNRFLNKPIITSKSRGHVFENESFVLHCEVIIGAGILFDLKWDIPKTVDKNRIEVTPTTHVYERGQTDLTVINAKITDSGRYKCIVNDNVGNIQNKFYTMTVLGENESFINLTAPLGRYNISDNAHKKIIINAQFIGHPHPTIRWLKSDGTEITHSHKFDVNITDGHTSLIINNAQVIDSGDYTVEANNSYVVKKQTFHLSVKDIPELTIADVYVQAGEETEILCKVLSFEAPKVYWNFTTCQIKPVWPTCLDNDHLLLNSSLVEKGSRNIEYIHRLIFKPETPGIIRCMADNKIGSSIGGVGHVFITDIKENMVVYGVDENNKIARGDEVIITCGALAYFYTNVNWYKHNILVQPNNDIEIIPSNSEYSYKKIIRFKNISDDDIGSYECRASPASDHEPQQKFIDISVYEPSPPTLTYTNLDAYNNRELQLADPLELECITEGLPRPSVIWYKDDVELKTMEKKIDIYEENSKLKIQHLLPGDEGVYKCVASNRLGQIERSCSVEIDIPGLGLKWIMSILIFIALLLGLVIYLCVRVHRERQLLRELKAAGLENFEEGAVEHINPALTLDEQADLLPYDRNFEFPRERLKLGKQLGAGAFGVVLKAHAEGIKPDEKETVVAVKMVKRTADNEIMRALVSELKIMIHLGQHLNVVNLLGAVTKNIVKKELMVIVEFCRYGNVQNVLMKNRKHFINQINPETDKIDPTITCSRFSDSFESNRNSESDPRSGTRAGRPNSSGYLRRSDLYEGQVDSCHTVMTTVPGDDEHVLSNNSVQPAWRSNYKPDSNEAMTISTSDLISWAFQVARGMDYLSSKRVLHGDLAARNILLCEDNVVKICDFGLARTMYNNNNYKKQGEAPLPIKWLALESLSDHVFSTYTDVWSFGIVLWEFFSLAKVPYTGMDANQNLYLKLKDGYRMEKPPYANDDLYDIMLECWSANPESRPLFTDLEKRFARMLGDEITNHYMDLNEPYLRSNNTFKGLSQIYFPQPLGSPDELAPAPPRYVNGHILPEIRIECSSDDYLDMHTDNDAVIFSPTRPNEYEYEMPTTKTNMTSFTFPEQSSAKRYSPTLGNNLDSPKNAKNLKKEGLEPEEIPMLQNENVRELINEYQDNPKLNSMPKPSPRHFIEETKLIEDANYINIKTSPHKINNNNNNNNNTNGRTTQDAFSNPGYQALKNFEK